MGKNEELVEDIEDVLGLNEEEQANKSENNQESKDDDEIDADKNDDKQKEITPPKTNIITLTAEQVEINKELTKLESKLEELESHNVDTNEFYDNLEKQLSEEEQQLEFSDKKAYLKIVREKEKEWIAAHSKDKEIEDIKKQKEELEKVYERQEAINQVTSKYPDFNYEEAMSFYQKKLTMEEQEEVLKSSNNYADVYENTYKKMIEKNPKNIKSQTPPDIPNVNNARKENVKSETIKDGFKDDDEILREALGL
jgi:chromosome segregation ATPase